MTRVSHHDGGDRTKVHALDTDDNEPEHETCFEGSLDPPHRNVWIALSKGTGK